jgi:hypothetical protein
MLAKATIAVASNTNSKALTLGRIGTSTTFSSFDFNGNMDEWRFTNGVGRYVSDGGFTVPTAAYPRGDISPPAGSLALSGQAATISFRQNYAPAAKVLALQGYAPVLVAGSQGLSPGAGSLGITGYAGSMVFRLNKIPPKASLSLTGQVPSLSLSAPGGSGGSNSVITCAAIF